MNENILIQIQKNELKTLVRSAISEYFNENGSGEANKSHDQQLMTVTEAASFLNISIPTIYGKVSKKEIPFHKKGKRLYFSKNELIDWVKS